MAVREIKIWDCQLGYQCEPCFRVRLNHPSDLSLLSHASQGHQSCLTGVTEMHVKVHGACGRNPLNISL